MILLVATFLVLSLTAFADWKDDLRAFFQRSGYVVGVRNNEVLLDMGKQLVREGEELKVLREGGEIKHPVTGQVLGREETVVAVVRVVSVKENYSVAKVEKGRDIKVGDRVKVDAQAVCYEGSEEGFFKVSSVLENVKRGKDCRYVIKEFPDGFGVELEGRPIAFFQSQGTQILQPRATIQDINILVRSKYVKQLPGIPISADTGDLYGNGKDNLVVLYQGRLEVYEMAKNDLIRRSSFSLPAGTAVSVYVAPLGREKTAYVIVNMISGGKASSLILKAVGDSLIPVVKDIPYLMAVLDKNRPTETFVGQSFSSDEMWGKVVKLSLEGGVLKEAGNFPAPRGFRIDGAFYYGHYLLFTDSSGRVRVFDGDNEVFSTEDIAGGSYSYVELNIGESKLNLLFYPRGVVAKVLDFNVALVPRNVRSEVFKFLDVVKFSRGELFLLGEKGKDLIVMKSLRGGNWEEAIQAVVTTRDGRVFVLTGRTGTVPVQNRGDVYELEFRLL